MEELVIRLIGESRVQQAVAMSTLDNGIQVFAYPLADERMLVALGVGSDSPLRAEELLTRRAANLTRLDGWLPAMFNDGSLYLLRRLRAEEEEGGDVLARQLALAEELLN